MLLKEFDFNLPEELFRRVKLMAEDNRFTVSKMMIYLIEEGYLQMIKGGKKKEVYDKQINSK